MTPTPETASSVEDAQDRQRLGADGEPQPAAEIEGQLIEEVSIDGLCGVY